MSRTLAIDGCHELCLLHLTDLNRVRHALIASSLLNNRSLCPVI